MHFVSSPIFKLSTNFEQNSRSSYLSEIIKFIVKLACDKLLYCHIMFGLQFKILVIIEPNQSFQEKLYADSQL